MHIPNKLETYQNIIPNGYDKSNIEIYPKHLPNYYQEYRQPKIANQVSYARYHIRVPLEIGNI
jgi:hypothetical protein